MPEFKHITPADAQALRENGAVFVDIRDPQTFASGHISGARHLDNHSVQAFIDAADLDAPLVVVCYHGNSSQSAAAYLASQGFSEVYSLDGGFEQWRSTFAQHIEQGTPE
ncbi:thiosulfate sulfurtransferase GlpE [Pseudomonas typographi]|uniref:Thiosulfate sulfurtransferase GlpE n=1 Tax=Pseudomonas typographi TaxID=2715964 RepID=A0ABR7YVF8_9PSED|nr:thiosulfate sulfurtransferase GlpE [Pseudomonas typographi]MBD1552110.1 thiosulfate sulfurtransferase GlpE [Pseudomonas typographi]MBD1585082.1 thiosulfate sulfurtransferase GlpE [Pseudomonas typographi]MBD1597129.1 thiosulfate sulfurtransferase GlpE [Pseudomonas typographi]